MNEVMIDIETMSIKPNALILTIGAIKFNREDEVVNLEDMDTFYRRIQYNEENNNNFHICPDTQKWWDNQHYDAQYEAFHHPERKPLENCLKELLEWFGNSQYVWANGSVFDIPILEHSFRVCGIEIPWKFWNIRDVRTIMDVGNIKKGDINKKGQHMALYDCFWQIKAVQKSFKNIKNN